MQFSHELIEIKENGERIFKGTVWEYIRWITDPLKQRISALENTVQELKRNQGSDHRDR